VSTTPNVATSEDEVYVLVRRTIGGVSKLYVERFSHAWQLEEGLPAAYFVDCGLTYSGPPLSLISTGLFHLVGQVVQIFADGTVRDTATVTSTGAVGISGPAASVVAVGLPMGTGVLGGAVLETHRFEAGAQDGTAQGKVKRIRDVVLRLLNVGAGMADIVGSPSVGALYYGLTSVVADMDLLSIKEDQDPIGAEALLLSGDTRELPLPLGHDRKGRVALRHAAPTPCTIIAIMPHMETEDRL
jgi:hypothetical protein